MKCHGRCCSVYYTILLSNTLFIYGFRKKAVCHFEFFFISSLGNTSSFVLNLLTKYFSQLLGADLTTKATFSVVQRKDK